MVMSLPPPDFSGGGSSGGLGSMMPSISPSFTGGNAGPSQADATNEFRSGGVYNTFSSPFIVGGEGNTATGGVPGTSLSMPMIALGGIALWFLLKK